MDSQEKASNSRGFQHRSLVGWISEFSSRPLHDPWPIITLDSQMMRDFIAIFDLCKQVGLDKIIIWGLFVERRWPVQIEKAIDKNRRRQIQELLDAAHKRGIKILSGLGVYSWGFEEIIEIYPRLNRGNSRAMCPSVPESEKWMQRVVDFVLSEFDLDGVQMQSADQGRCKCKDCQKWGDVEYHAKLNDRTAQYIRSKWQDRTISVNNWGLSFADPNEIPHLQRMTGSVDILVDYNNSAGKHRKQLIGNLDCAFGTLAGSSVGPPQRWERTKWFLPTTTINVPYLRALYDDGGEAIEQFTVALSNPGGEVTLRFMGKISADLSIPQEKALRESIAECFEPKDSATTDGLMGVFQRAENGYFKLAEQEHGPAGLFYIDSGLSPGPDGDQEQYLLRMSDAQLKIYGDEIRSVLRQLEQLGIGVGKKDKWERVRESLNTVLLDIQKISA